MRVQHMQIKLRELSAVNFQVLAKGQGKSLETGHSWSLGTHTSSLFITWHPLAVSSAGRSQDHLDLCHLPQTSGLPQKGKSASLIYSEQFTVTVTGQVWLAPAQAMWHATPSLLHHSLLTGTQQTPCET